VALAALPCYAILLAFLVRTLCWSAPPVGSNDAKFVFAGLNKTGWQVFLVLVFIFWPLCWIPWRFVSCRTKQPGMTADSGRRWIWPAPGTRLAMLTVLMLLAGYVGSYAWLSRRGALETRDSGIDGFLYVPTAEIMATQDLRKHHRLAVFYAPANAVDCALFGMCGPVRGIMFGLAESEPADLPQ
ncbi:MAG TPA: hypothetical protein VGG30_04125, partial [Pirellulales bacterium]